MEFLIREEYIHAIEAFFELLEGQSSVFVDVELVEKHYYVVFQALVLYCTVTYLLQSMVNIDVVTFVNLVWLFEFTDFS